MAEWTKIGWCDMTFNLWIGCEEVSEGCRYCYAKRDARKYWPTMDLWGKGSSRKSLSEGYWRKLFSWNKKAESLGRPLTVFVGSMCDIMEIHSNEKINQFMNSNRKRLYTAIEQTPNLIYLLLTKRPENYEKLLPREWTSAGYADIYNKLPEGAPIPSNVWLGCTMENQKNFDQRMPVMEWIARQFHAAGMFLSLEPLLGPINTTDWLYPNIENDEDHYIENRVPDWIIVGGESGEFGKARMMEIDYARRIIEDCKEAEVPVYFKQTGSAFAKYHQLNSDTGKDISEWPETLRIQQFPEIFGRS